MAKGDMNTVHDSMMAILNQLIQSLPQIACEKTRNIIENVFVEKSEWMKKMPIHRNNIEGIRNMTIIAKDVLKQRLAGKILAKIRQK